MNQCEHGCNGCENCINDCTDCEESPITPQAQAEALLPCPFCGGTATSTGPWEIGTSDKYEAVIECLHCNFQISSHDGTLFDKSKALRVATEKWNSRTPAL